jgi:phosphoenolpyruvate carboxykinase (ATP)
VTAFNDRSLVSTATPHTVPKISANMAINSNGIDRMHSLRRHSLSTAPASDNTDSSSSYGREHYQISQSILGPDACKKSGLHHIGITGPTTVYRNLSYQELFDHEVSNNEGVVVNAEYGPTFAVDTGKYTGRSPKDRFIVLNPGSETATNIDWNKINQPIAPDVYQQLYDKAIAHMNTRENVYVFDGICGANPSTAKNVRFVHEMAWQQHFVSNMFIRPTSLDNTLSESAQNEPDFTVINCCSQTVENWKELGLNSETAVVFNVEAKTAVIFGTWYGGENKKGIFSLMNYWLPMQGGHLPMHCSANVDPTSGDVALFFGLSGTGKTTLSADPHRALIGDDEHGWDNDGVFNFEGGCYAKTINLKEANEPDIYRAIRTDALLENVKVLTDQNNIPDYADTSKTENGRVSYPIFHIPNYVSIQNHDINSRLFCFC